MSDRFIASVATIATSASLSTAPTRPPFLGSSLPTENMSFIGDLHSSPRSHSQSSELSAALVAGAEHGRVGELQRLPVAEVGVDAAGQAGVEAAHRPHDVDALEVVRPVLLEDGRVLDRVLVGPGRAVDVARARVPR